METCYNALRFNRFRHIALFEVLDLISFAKNKPRIVVGLVLAIIAVAALVAVRTPNWVVPLTALGFLAFGLVTYTPKDPVRTMLIVLIPVAGAFLLMWLVQGAMGSHVLPLTFGEFLLGVGIGLGMILFWTLITGRTAWGAALGMAALIALVTANYFVYTFRGTELLPTDVLAWRTAMSVAGEYDYIPSANVVQVWVFWALYVFAASGVKLGALHRKTLTLSGGAILIALSIGIGLGMTGMTSQQWRLHGTDYNGFLLNFAIELRDSFVHKPSGYDVQKLAAQTAEYDAPTAQATAEDPTIIVIMDESFADFRVLGQHFRTNIDVMPFIDSLQENTIRGFALSSVYGGGTANSEYEFLTGNTLGFLPQGCVAYQQYLPENPYSMVSALKDRGYETVAMHPYFSKGWMRNTVWPSLGFSQTYFLEDFPQRDLVRTFVSDQEMFEKIILRYNTRDKEKPMFLFGVTMQNHGGYRYSGTDFISTVRLQGFSHWYDRAEQYLTLAHDTDLAVEYLINYFAEVEEPVVIAFFGDHLPSLDTEFYEEIHGGAFDTLSEQMLQYEIPFFVWANYDIEEQTVPISSINYLSNYVYEAAGLEKPVYSQMLADLQQTVPALNSKCFYDAASQTFLPYSDAEGDAAEALKLYNALQYNNTFDTKHRIGIFDRED